MTGARSAINAFVTPVGGAFMSWDQTSQRWAVRICLAVIVLAVGRGKGAEAAGPLEMLLKNYQTCEFPIPSANAELAAVAGRTITIRDGVREQGRHLVFPIQKAERGNRAVLAAGTGAADDGGLAPGRA